MRISSTGAIGGGSILYTIGKIKAASSWHAAGGAPLQDNWREFSLSGLIRKAEEIDAYAIIGIDYETDSVISCEETDVKLKRIFASGWRSFLYGVVRDRNGVLFGLEHALRSIGAGVITGPTTQSAFTEICRQTM